ncbi:hypothetical protein NYO99_11985 [Pelomonas sp. UHG3]|uniref:Uncharacterized protein n=1 Tax=Roseateles hydrophilus TaxID=2975054 RepID=A0ACC6CB89_9BURK|nr:hypothetical protein [Pelomonas sp. UHG3]
MSALPSNPGAGATREQVVAILELLETRMLWSTAKPIISATGIHTSRGWRETIAQARGDSYSDAIWASAYKSLSVVARWHTYVGNKHVSFFDLREQNEDAKALVLDWARNRAVEDLKGVVRRRPFNILEAPTRKADLEPYKNAEPKLLAAEFQGGKLYLQFFSTRAYTMREPLDITRMSAAQARLFEEYEEVIGVRTRLVPCFDTVVVDTANDLVELRVDFQPGMTEDKNSPAFVRVMNEFNRATTKFIGQGAVGVGLMNLHPAINPMYQDAACGRVTALGFVATSKASSSNNHGQIHRTKTQDFRKDSFHVGGKQHVDKVDPYTIGITWPAKPSKGDLYLELKGSVRAIYSGKLRAVTTAEFLGCLDGADYDFIADQVLRRLPRRKK